MFSLIIVNTWRGLPFYAITLLAGLQSISPELYGRDDRRRQPLGALPLLALPLLLPIIFIVTMFSVIFTFADFQLIYVLTRGGPANATHVFATYAFDIAMGAGQFGQGAAIALSMVPALALIILAMAIYMRAPKWSSSCRPRASSTSAASCRRSVRVPGARFPIVAAAAALAALAACSEAEAGHGEGVVLETHDDGRIVIEHGDIPGVMKAMTMEFEIDPDLLKGIESGDRVTFAIEADGGRYHVTAIREQPPG